MANEDSSKRRSFLLGMGLDNKDGHRRITRGDGFHLEGGSSETHEKMQEVVIKVGEKLKKKGREIPTASIDEVSDAVRDVTDRMS